MFLFVIFSLNDCFQDGATTKKKTTTKVKPKITATKKVLKTTLKTTVNPRLRSLPLPIDPNATTPPPEYYYYEEDIDNPEYVTGDDTNDYDVTEPSEVEAASDYPATDPAFEYQTPAPTKKNKKKHKKNLKKFLHNLAQRSKKNGQRLINRLGKL